MSLVSTTVPLARSDGDRLQRNMSEVFGALHDLAVEIRGTNEYSTTKHTFEQWASSLGMLIEKAKDVVFDVATRAQRELTERGKTAAGGTASLMGSVRFGKSQGSAAGVEPLNLPALGATTAPPPAGKPNLMANMMSKIRANALKEASSLLTVASMSGGPAGGIAAAPTSPPHSQSHAHAMQQHAMGSSSTVVPFPAGSHQRLGTPGHAVVPSPPPKGGHHSSSSNSAGGLGTTPSSATAAARSYTIVESADRIRTAVAAQSVHVALDAVLRQLRGRRAVLYAAHRGDIKDMRAICAVGDGPDTHLPLLRCRDPQSPILLSASTGMIITCGRGRLPATAVESTALGALTGDQFSGGVMLRDTRTKVWSSLSVPVLPASGDPTPIGVVHVTDKDSGRGSFDGDDEHFVYGCSRLLTSVLDRVPDIEGLATAFNASLAMGPVSHPHAGANFANLTVPTLRTQLVFRTWDLVPQVREVRILSFDKRSAIRLDERVPVQRVSDYIANLQQAWLRTAMINVEFQKSFESRSKYIGKLIANIHTLRSRIDVLEHSIGDRMGAGAEDAFSNRPSSPSSSGGGGHASRRASQRRMLNASTSRQGSVTAVFRPPVAVTTSSSLNLSSPPAVHPQAPAPPPASPMSTKRQPESSRDVARRSNLSPSTDEPCRVATVTKTIWNSPTREERDTWLRALGLYDARRGDLASSASGTSSPLLGNTTVAEIEALVAADDARMSKLQAEVGVAATDGALADTATSAAKLTGIPSRQPQTAEGDDDADDDLSPEDRLIAQLERDERATKHRLLVEQHLQQTEATRRRRRSVATTGSKSSSATTAGGAATTAGADSEGGWTDDDVDDGEGGHDDRHPAPGNVTPPGGPHPLTK